MRMNAARQACERGRLFWFDTAKTGTIFAVADAGDWLATADESAPDERGFDWVRRTFPDMAAIVGAPVGDEKGYQGELERTADGWRLTDIDGRAVVLVHEPEPEPVVPPEEVPEEPEPEPMPQPQQPVELHVVQTPVFAVFDETGEALNLNQVARFVRQEDGRALVYLKITDIEVDEDGSHTLSGASRVYLPEAQADELWALLRLIGWRLPLEA